MDRRTLLVGHRPTRREEEGMRKTTEMSATVACVPVGFQTENLRLPVRSVTASVNLLVRMVCSKCDGVRKEQTGVYRPSERAENRGDFNARLCK